MRFSETDKADFIVKVTDPQLMPIADIALSADV